MIIKMYHLRHQRMLEMKLPLKEYHDYPRLNELANIACDNIEELLFELGVEYNTSSKFVFGPCPVHGGDNPSAWNLYPNGDEVRGHWKCRTHHCEQKWKKTLFGFVWGVLSRQSGQQIPWTEAVDWVVNFLGYTSLINVPHPTDVEVERRKQTTLMHKLRLAPEPTKTEWDKAKVRQELDIPALYYVNRGYSKEILDKYDVGFHYKSKRIVVPIYDDLYTKIIGFTARTMFDQCPLCKLYHMKGDQCPSDIGGIINAGKWKNNDGFNRSNYLYNTWFARQHILQEGKLILVEGPGDVWKLEMAGIHYSLAVFGTELTEEQLIVLRHLGSYLSIIILADNDDAGHKAKKDWQEKLHRQYELFIPELPAKDTGAMDVEFLRDFIGRN